MSHDHVNDPKLIFFIIDEAFQFKSEQQIELPEEERERAL